MIRFKYDEEKLTALYFADLLHDELARKIIEACMVANSAEATYLSQFYWRMVDAAVVFEKEKKSLPFAGSPDCWTEKLLRWVASALLATAPTSMIFRASSSCNKLAK